MAQHQLRKRVSDPLARHLLPVLVHRMNNTTQLLSNLEALSRVDAARNWLGERSEDLLASSLDVDRLGYLLAVIASSNGANLLLERRVAEGLQIMVEAVRDVARRREREVAAPSHPLPLQAPNVHAGWELTWGFGALLLSAALERGPGGRVDWQLLQEIDSWVLVSSSTVADGFAGLCDLIAERLPETQLDVRREGWSWRVPAPWLLPNK